MMNIKNIFLVSHSMSALKKFLTHNAAGGIVLMISTAIALIISNSPLADNYFSFIHMSTGIILSEKLGPMTLHLWINDGLMTIFFLLVGLEIKRQLVDGRLSTWEQRRLPILPAILGMLVPGIIYMVFTYQTPSLKSGWAIPTATDIAFAIGALALIGRHAPLALKLLLVTIAIIDDIGAVIIIAIFYTSEINFNALLLASVVISLLFLFNRMRILVIWPYLIGIIFLWYVVLLSGVHSTIAGVIGAFLIPYKSTPNAPDSTQSPLHRLEHLLAPCVGLVIVPLFGFVNAGISLFDVSIEKILAPLPMGITAGLFIGKQLGVFSGVLLAIKLGLAAKPRGTTWLQIYAMAMLCGIGFTMSLFINGLAFPLNYDYIEEAKIGIMLGSFTSLIIACCILRFAPKAHDHYVEIERQRAEIRQDGDVDQI